MIARSKPKISFENQLPWIIIFGTVWGLLELFLAPVIKNYAKGLFGIIMPFISIGFILIAKYRIPARGSVFLSAVIASAIKYFFSGMVLKGAFMAILIEALLVESFYVLGGFSLWVYISSGISVQLYSAFHPLITKGLLCQSSHFIFFKKFIFNNFNIALEKQNLIIVLIGLHILTGIVCGLFAWIFSFRFSKLKIKEI